MSMMASLITGVSIVYSTMYSGADQRKHQSSASLAFVRVIYRWPLNSPHKGLVTWKMFPFNDVIVDLIRWCIYAALGGDELIHWGRVTHICVSKLTIIGSDNGLSPDRRQAIIWTNAGLLLIGPLGTNFSEILIEILKFSFKKMPLNVSSAKRRPFCPGLNVLIISANLNCNWNFVIWVLVLEWERSRPIQTRIHHHREAR